MEKYFIKKLVIILGIITIIILLAAFILGPVMDLGSKLDNYYDSDEVLVEE